jgi:caffeoyl-CoA O-methyltransferase
MLNEFSAPLLAYCESKTTPIDTVLNDLIRETHLTRLQPQMISGAFQGQLLTMLAMMIQPKAILEIGAYTGFSAICMARGLQQNGILHTIEVNEEQEDIIRKYIAKAAMTDTIHLYIGSAFDVIPTLKNILFDLVFIDAGKDDYPAYLELVLPLVRKGGFIFADNVLWSGKVLDEKHDRSTAILHKFNTDLANDPRLEVVLLPVRDGISLIRKL